MGHLEKLFSNSISIHSINDYVNNVNMFRNASNSNRQLYRGESRKYNTPNVACVLRNNSFRKQESAVYIEYQKQFINKLSVIDDAFDKLEFMQHYGLYTRLLDLSKDSLVALYFACCKHQNESGYVYFFDEPSPNDKVLTQSFNYNDDVIKLISNLSLMNTEDKYDLIRYGINNSIKDLDTKSIKFLSELEYNDKYSIKATNEIYHISSSELDSVKDALKKMKLSHALRKLYLRTFSDINYPLNIFYVIDKSLMVDPDFNNKRIKAQSGCFLLESYISNRFKSPKEIMKDVSKNIFNIIEIPGSYKPKILTKLDDIYNINEATIYRDYASVADYLNHHIDDL